MIAYEDLIGIVADVFEAAGLRRERARELSALFVTTEAKGVSSHGVNLSLKYVEQFRKGTINLEPNLTVLRETPAAAVLDGDRGLGVTVIRRAVRMAVEKAKRTGIAALTITNLQHYAAGLYYVDEPVSQGVIMTMMANSPASMAPFGGSAKYYGTNPYTFAAPMGSLPAYCLDMASSVCAGNKLENAMNLGKPVPLGLGLDRDGRPCTDPEEILKRGTLLPFGGAKGSGLAGMINIMAGVLSGSAYKDDVISLCRDANKPSNYGCQIQILDIAAFMDMAEYSARAEEWGQAVLKNPPAEGFSCVVYPGYVEGMRLRRAMAEGMELSEISRENLIKAGELVAIDVEALLNNCGG